MLKIIEITDRKEWDEFVLSHGGHPLQLWGWGELKAKHGWKVRRVFLKNGKPELIDRKKKDHSDIIAAAQILVKKLPFPLNNFAYIPRGAVILSQKSEERARLLNEIANFAKNNIKPRPVCLSVEPDWEAFPTQAKGWRRAKNTILIPQTLILDLTKSKDELLAEMTKKTRQYIRKSDREVIIRQVKNDMELEQALQIYQDTAHRAGFAIHGLDYYRDLYKIMGENAPIYGAFIQKETDEEIEKSDFSDDFKRRELEKNQELVAFLWLAKSDKTTFELYGGVNDLGQKLRANYALKWHTIQDVKGQGVERYDFNGLLNDGISKFKAGFSNHQDMLAGTFDKPLSPLYFIWNNCLPMAKKIVRMLKNRG